MIAYIETSAVAKLLFTESESRILATFLDQVAANGQDPVTSLLTETELRRAAVREGASQGDVTRILDGFDQVEPDRAIFTEAGVLPGDSLRSLDAIHAVTAMRTSAEVFVTYDRRQAGAAEAVGLRVISPVSSSD